MLSWKIYILLIPIFQYTNILENRDCGHCQKLLNLAGLPKWIPILYKTLIIYYQGVVSFHEAFQYERSAIHVLSGVTETTCMSMIRHRADSRYILVFDNDYKSCTTYYSFVG
jgi:hypothetical protein